MLIGRFLTGRGADPRIGSLVPFNNPSRLEIAKLITALNVHVDQTEYIYYKNRCFAC